MNKKKFVVSFVATLLAVVVIYLGLSAAKLLSDTSLSGAITQFLDKANSNKMNVLLLGLDKEAKRADVIMVVSLDPDRERISVLSIPRDTRVKVSNTRYDKINHTMGYKNPEETIINAVKDLTGMPIHYYCEVSFEAFRNCIDILDGVEFDVPVDMHYEDPVQGLKIHVNKGLQVLNGEQAEGVVRFRNTYARADLQRIEVQQDFMKALFKQKLTPKYITKAPKIIKEMYKEIKTNLSVSTAIKYSKMLRKLDENSLVTKTLPGTPKMISGISYVVPNEAELKEVVLHDFGYPEDEAKKLEKDKSAGAEGPIDELK